jgi:hypothetical protein
MSKYKIHINPKEPDKERTAKHKDFKKLVANYDKLTKPLYKKPLYKDPRTFLAIVFIILIIILVFESVEEEENTPKTPSQDSISNLR